MSLLNTNIFYKNLKIFYIKRAIQICNGFLSVFKSFQDNPVRPVGSWVWEWENIIRKDRMNLLVPHPHPLPEGIFSPSPGAPWHSLVFTSPSAIDAKCLGSLSVLMLGLLHRVSIIRAAGEQRCCSVYWSGAMGKARRFSSCPAPWIRKCWVKNVSSLWLWTIPIPYWEVQNISQLCQS